MSPSPTLTTMSRLAERYNLEILHCGLSGFESDGELHLFVIMEWASTEIKAGAHITMRRYLVSLPASMAKRADFLEAANDHVAQNVTSSLKRGVKEESIWLDLSRTLHSMSADTSARN